MAAPSPSSDPYGGIGAAEPPSDPYAAVGVADAPADPYAEIGVEETAAAAVPEPPRLEARQNPGLLDRAGMAVRELLSPVLGETQAQTMRRQQLKEELRTTLPQLAGHIEAEPNAALDEQRMQEGAVDIVPRVLFTPAQGAPQIPMIPPQEGAAAQVGAGIVNTVSTVANSMVSPGGALLAMGGAPAKLVGAALIPAMTKTAIKDAPKVLETVQDPAVSLQEKTEAVAGEALAVAGAGLGLRAVRKAVEAKAPAKTASEPTKAPEVPSPAAVEAVAEATPAPVRLVTAQGELSAAAEAMPGAVRAALEGEIPAGPGVPPSPTAKPLGLVESAKSSPEIVDPLRKGLQAFYEPKPNAESIAQATAKIDALGSLDRAKADYLGNRNPDAVANAMGLELVRKYQAEGRLVDVADVIYDMAGKAKTQGQAIQILSTLSRATPEGMVAYATKLLDRKLTSAEVAEISAAQTRIQAAQAPEVRLARQAQLMDAIHSKLPAKWDEKLAAAQNIALLLNPKTIVRNVGGNVIMALAELSSDAVTPMVDAGVSVITKGRSVSGPQVLEYLKGLAQPVRDVKLGYKQGRAEGLTRGAAFGEGVKTMATLAKLTSAGATELAEIGRGYRTVFSNPLMRYLEKTLTISLGTTDRAFYTARLRASLRDQMKSAGAASPTGAMVDRAAMEASRAIYQDNNLISNRMREVRRTLNMGDRRRFGLGQVIMPFTQVPGALLMRGIEYSPAGFIRAAYRLLPERVTGSTFDQRAFVQDFTHALGGTTALTATGFYLTKLGVITGAPDENRDVEALRRKMGLGGFRINVSELKRRMQSMDWQTPALNPPPDGDVVVSYDWAQPVAFPVALGADAAEFERNEVRRQARGKIPRTASEVMSAIISAGRTIEEQPMLTGLSGFFTAAANAKRGDGAGVLEAMYGSMLKLPGVFFPTAVRNLQAFMDNRVYETRGTDAMESAYRQIGANVPGLATALGYKPRFDVLGDLSERYHANGNSAFSVFINPAFVTGVQGDPVARELYAIWARTGETKQLPRVVDHTITVNGQQKVLTAPEIADYQQFVGRITRDAFGTLMRNEGYARADDQQRAKVLARVVSAAAQAGRILLFGDRPKTLDQFDRALLGSAMKDATTAAMAKR